jgi:hypothetical protein
VDLCRLLSAPAGSRTFPALSLRIFLYVLESLPRLLLWCTYPFLPTEQRPSRRFEPVGAWLYPHGNFCVGGLSRLQLFVYLQARRFARHPDCSHRCISSTQGGHGFYVPAYLGLLPRRAGDMLTVRFGQLTVEGLSPSKIHSLAGCSQTEHAG